MSFADQLLEQLNIDNLLKYGILIINLIVIAVLSISNYM